jgi:hypothetical protein
LVELDEFLINDIYVTVVNCTIWFIVMSLLLTLLEAKIEASDLGINFFYTHNVTMILSKLIFSLFLSLIITTVILIITSTAFSLKTNENQYSFTFKWRSKGTSDGQFLILL